jgi:hypothetical protein
MHTKFHLCVATSQKLPSGQVSRKRYIAGHAFRSAGAHDMGMRQVKPERFVARPKLLAANHLPLPRSRYSWRRLEHWLRVQGLSLREFSRRVWSLEASQSG